ncbi:melanoma inhibitory activity protein 2-like isoform X2 [Saccostrea echinata]|uniref:melanoma inhibitory activity protein 2-like isoform X2 n=1 Tax=Saccostrea echinata TaxID=191078 RepID=UPI002A7FD566|nr:melanoma inhibitory activity protein 2-like isoform X2 [Saccostrea echinata]
MKLKEMTDALKSKKVILALLSFGLIINECSSSRISDLRLCGDKECKTTLSYGRTLAKHMQNDPIFLNFERNVMLEITSKSAGDRPDLWGGRLDGKTGYFPRSFVREYKVENPSPQFIVPTEISDGKVIELQEKPVTPPNKAEDDTEVDEEEDQDDTEVEDEEDDLWWEDDKDKGNAKKDEQKEQEKPIPLSPGPPKDNTQTEQKDSIKREQNVESQSSDSQQEEPGGGKENQGTETKVEEIDPVPSGEKDPTEAKEAREGQSKPQNEANEGGGSQLHIKKENRVKEKLDELRESLFSLHNTDDEDKVKIDELNKMLEEGSKKKQPESTEEVPSTISTEKPDSAVTDSEQGPSQKVEDDVKTDDEALKLPGLSDLLKEGVDDAKKVSEDLKPPEEDETEIGDETEISNEESSTQAKQEVIKDAGKDADSILPDGLPVGPPMTDKEGLSSGQGAPAVGIQPSSVIQNKKEEDTLLQSSFTAEESASQTVEQRAGSTSTPGLTEIHSSVTEASTVNEAPQQTAMEGYTIIDGTPFPLDMFEDPTSTGNVAKQTESVMLFSTPTQQHTSSVSVDHIFTSSEQERAKQTTAQSKTVSESLEQSSQPPVVSSQTKTDVESVRVDTASSTDIVPTETGGVTASSEIGSESPKVGTESIDSKHSVPDTRKGIGKIQAEKAVKEAVKSENMTAMMDLEKSANNTLSQVKDAHAEDNEDKTAANVKENNEANMQKTETEVKESSENVTDTKSKIGEGKQKPAETVEEQKPLESSEQPNLSVLKFLGEEDTSLDSVSDDENVREMNIPNEGEKTVEEGKQEQINGEMTDKPIQEQMIASTVPSTSPVEQLMSSMESDYRMDNKNIIDNTKNTAIAGDQQNASKTVIDTDHLKIELPPTVDAYSTADFLSRKPLSHEPHKLPDSVKEEGKPEEIPKDVGEQKEETVTEAPLLSTTQPETETSSTADKGIMEENKQETVTESPIVSTTLSGSDGAEIPPPPTAPKESTTQPSSGQSAGEPAPKPEEVFIPREGGQSSSVSMQDIQSSSTDTVFTTETIPKDSESTTQGEQASTSSYEQEEFLSRKINDADLEEKEDMAYRAEMKGDRFHKSLITKLPPSVQALLEQEPLGLSPQMTILVTIVTLASLMIVTCCSVILGGGRKTKKQDPVVVVRGLEEKLFILTKEKENLEDELSDLQEKMECIEEDKKSTQSSVGDIQKDLQTLQLHNNALKEQVDTVSEENTEVKQELSQKTKELRSKDNQLKDFEKQIKQKDEKYNKTNEKLKEANKEVQEKSGEIKTLKSQVQSLTDQVSHLVANKSQLIEEAHVWSEKVKELTEQLDYVKGEQKQMAEDLAYKENEIEVLRDCFLQLKAFQNQAGEEGEEGEENRDETDSGNIESKLKSMMDVSQVSAKLKASEEEKRSLENRLDIEMQSRRDMEERILDLERKAENLQSDKMKAERQNSEAQTKLEVLSSYFKQKELELQRELGEQEALKKMNINKLENSDTRTKMMQEELDGSKAQVEDLKREILSAERDFRSQIAANEKKAHENWLAARAAERELKETRHEASVLRQKLTDLERRLMQGPPGGLIRPVPSRGMPPPGMMNGPPIPGMERPGSRGRLPPSGPRDEDFPGSPGPDSERRPPPPLGPDDRRIPPFNPEDRRMPFPEDRRVPPMDGPDRRQTPMGSRVPPPHPMDIRSPPPFDRRPPPPLDRRSPPPYERGLRLPPPPLDPRSPGHRMPFPPDMPPPPHLRGPPRGPLSPPLRNDGIDAPPYRPPHDPDREPRQQSQV